MVWDAKCFVSSISTLQCRTLVLRSDASTEESATIDSVPTPPEVAPTGTRDVSGATGHECIPTLDLITRTETIQNGG